MPPAPRSLTHLGVPVGDLVNLITETSPTPPGSVVPLSFVLRSDGSGEPFTLPAQTVFVLTDVIVTMPRGGAAPGRYVAGICNTPCVNSRVPIQVHTDVDGFQKTISLTGGVPFSNLPQFETLQSNPSDMAVQLYGYLVKTA
jgi:hypothetical protein